MKKIVFMLLCLSSVFRLSAQEQELSLELELVKPSGKLDGRAHFALHLKNTSDSLTVFIGKSLQTGKLQKVYEWNNGVQKVADGNPIFEYPDLMGRVVMVIKPREEHVIYLPLFGKAGWENNDGVLPFEANNIQSIRRVRIGIKALKHFSSALESSASNRIGETKTADFYSNWIDVDIAAFQKILDEANQSKKVIHP